MIGIICIIDLNYIPYLKKYTEYFDNNRIDYEVIYWKRMNGDESYPFKTRVFEYNADLKLKKVSKVKGFLKYRQFLKKILKENKYSKLVVLSTLMGMLIPCKILKQYSEKYIFDIRDYTYEKYYFYKKRERFIVKNSFNTIISSNAFKEFLPQSDKYVLCHNFLASEISESRTFHKNDSNPIELTFIGAVRHFELDKTVIDAFEKDNRFKLVFHGYGAAYTKLVEYTEDKNVVLTGKYDRKDKELLLSSSDIINSYYDDKNIVNKYAVSNKYYDSAIYLKPLWANPDTYIGCLAIEKGIGLNCKISPDDMYMQYKKLDPKNLKHHAKRLSKKYLKMKKTL